MRDALPPGPHPALDRAQARVLSSPAAHGLVRDLEFRVDGLVRDGLELLMVNFCVSRKSLQVCYGALPLGRR